MVPVICKTLTVLLLLQLFGCSSEGPPPSAKPAPKATAKQKVKKEEVVEKVVESPAFTPIYSYDPSGRRDPFQSLLEVRKIVQPDSAEPLTPLQRYGIGQLNLVAIVVGKGDSRALVVAPDKKSYVLKKGVKVGENGGEVVEITVNSVLVEEKFYDFTGEMKKSIRELKLPVKEGDY